MNTATATATSWVCDGCGVRVSRIGGGAVQLPGAWARSAQGTFCLNCRRERAAEAALAKAPEDTPIEARAKLRRAALIEFEVRRRPGHGNGEIAKACRSSVAAVAAARERLDLPAPRR
jgi:hypothetical protein